MLCRTTMITLMLTSLVGCSKKDPYQTCVDTHLRQYEDQLQQYNVITPRKAAEARIKLLCKSEHSAGARAGFSVQ